MKHVKFVLGMVAMASLLLFTACDPDDEDDVLGPLLTVSAESETVEPGDTINFSVEVRAGDAKLDELSITNAEGSYLEDLQGDKWENVSVSAPFNETISFVRPLAESYSFVFTVKDKDGLSETKTATITVTAEEDITEYTNKTLYAPAGDGTSESVIDLHTGTIYTINNGEANSSDIDMAYFYGQTKEASLAAPDVTIVGVDLTGWTKNATRFKTTAVDYANMSDALALADAWNSGTDEVDQINNLSAGDVVLFKTADEKHGAIKVNSIKLGYATSDYINITYKIKK